MSTYVLRSAMVVSLAAVTLAFAPSARAQHAQVAQQNGPGNLAKFVAGTIESIDTAAGTVTVKFTTGETLALTCDANCRFSIKGRAGVVVGPAGLKDLKVGDEMGVLFLERDGKPVALSFTPPLVFSGPLPKPGVQSYRGMVESVDAAAGTITVRNPQGETMTFICDATSRVSVVGTHAVSRDLKDVQIGDSATVAYTEKDGKAVCRELGASLPRHETLLGKITTIDAGTGTVSIKDADGWTATFTCAADCTFATNGGQNRNATLESLKVGDLVSAVCTKMGDKVLCHDLEGQQRVTP
jgi:Cu/Ag efflux protein CusF